MITLGDTSWYDRGKESALKFPELTQFDRSLEDARQERLTRENRQYQQGIASRDWMEKMMELDPVTAISTKNATDQAIALKTYNDKWTQRYQQRNGVLNEADRLEMIKDKSSLVAWQKNVMANQQAYLTAKKTIDSDTRGYFDHDIFAQKEQKYLLGTDKQGTGSGVLDPDILTVAPQDMGAWLDNEAKNLPRNTTRVKKQTLDASGNPVPGEDYYDDVESVPLSVQQNKILDGLSNEGRLKAVINDFDEWATKPQNDKAVYDLLKEYDTNHNGKIDPTEFQYVHQHMDLKDNPIVKWAINNPDYLNRMQPKEGASKNVPSPKAKTTFNWNIGVGMGNNRNGEYEVQKNIPVNTQNDGNFVFPDYMNLGRTSQTGESQVIKEKVVKDENGNDSIEPVKEQMPFHVIGYSPSKDQLVLGVDGRSSNYNYSKDDVIVVPAEDFDDLLKSKPFGIVRNKVQKPSEKPKINIGL